MADDVDPEVLRARFPNTWITHDSKFFYNGWLERRLLIARCDEHGHWHHPPGPVCPTCLTGELTPTEVSGFGVVHLLMQLHQIPPTPGIDTSRPHPVVTVELAEHHGLRLTSALVNYEADDLRIGLPVRLTWTERHGAPYPVFEPDDTRPGNTHDAHTVAEGSPAISKEQS
jgi:uncharacterized OB-fold protein